MDGWCCAIRYAGKMIYAGCLLALGASCLVVMVAGVGYVLLILAW